MRNEDAIFLKQSRFSVRSSAKGVVLCLALAAAMYIFGRGYGMHVKVFLYPAGVFFLIFVLEFFGLRRIEKKLRAAPPEEKPATEGLPETEYKLQNFPEEEEEWYVRRILVDGQPVMVRISTAPGALEKIRPHADALCEKPDELAARLRAFLAAEAEKDKTFGEEIRQLKLGSINFGIAGTPGEADVWFTKESSGEIFHCYIENGQFSDFGADW